MVKATGPHNTERLKWSPKVSSIQKLQRRLVPSSYSGLNPRNVLVKDTEFICRYIKSSWHFLIMILKHCASKTRNTEHLNVQWLRLATSGHHHQRQRFSWHSDHDVRIMILESWRSDHDTRIMTLGLSTDLHSDIQALRHSESHTLRIFGSRLGHKYPNRLSGGTLDTP